MQTEALPLFVDTQAAARLLGVSKSFLEKSRFTRDPDAPPHVIFGRNAVRYSTVSLLNWAATREVRHRRRGYAGPSEGATPK